MNVATIIDFYALAGTMKRFLPLLVVLGVVCGVMFNPAITSGLIGSALISGAMIISAGSEDSASWENFRASLPISRRQIVDGRYVAMLLFALLLLFVVLAVSGITLFCQWQLSDARVVPIDRAGALLAVFGEVATTYGALTIVAAAILPVLMRYGMAGSLRFIVLGAYAFVICVGVAFGEDIPNTQALPDWLEAIPACLVVLVVAACAWIVSYFVARAWYVRKEF